MDAAPTTLYMMLGERCDRDCAFCAQSRTSQAPQSALSRVSWPEFPVAQIVSAAAAAHDSGRIGRACFQVTASRGTFEAARRAVARLSAASAVPICVSIAVHSVEQVRALLEAGAHRVTLALDAATPSVYTAAKHGSWRRANALLEQSALVFPGRIGTHLIVGLGETEREMVEAIQRLADLGVSIGLFAFTPIAHTAWAERQPPQIGHYRRIQAALWLIVRQHTAVSRVTFAADGRLADLGITPKQLCELLADGDAFRTPGCSACNRPYYNERPGGTMYNYPRPLTAAEAAAAAALVCGSTGVASPAQ
ncbi:MAG: radical SAM protein [Chloroflexi bacterium]|nr:radical SAM protein [Chloroflexota bacterium]